MRFRCAAMVLGLALVIGCEKNVPPDSQDSGEPPEQDAGLDAGVDAGTVPAQCSLAAQDCGEGHSCLLSSDGGALAPRCFPGGCDLVAQGCEAGHKCTYVLDAGVATRECTPVGDGLDGDACTGTATSNSCGAGLTCVVRPLEDGGSGAVCLRFCYRDADCYDLDRCFLVLDQPGSEERPLVCSRPCDLLAQDCPAGGLACYPGPTVPGCYPEGSRAPGEDCTFSDECQAGSACVNAHCRALCQHPTGEPGCDGGTCTLLEIPGTTSVGACL
jgi:hypothetical protein